MVHNDGFAQGGRGAPVDSRPPAGRGRGARHIRAGGGAHRARAPVRDRRPALALSPLDEPLRGGDRQHRRRRRRRRLLPRRARARREGAEVEATTPAAEKIYRSDGPAARIETALVARAGRAAPLAAAGDASCSRRPARAARLRSTWPRDAELIVVEAWFSAASRWARPRSTRALERFLAHSPRRRARLRRRDPARPRRRERSTAWRSARARGRSPRSSPRRPMSRRACPICGRRSRPRATRSKRARAPSTGSSSRASSRRRRADCARPLIASILALGGREPPRLWR